MKILDKEVEFSFTDAENVEKLENSIEIAQIKMNKINQEGKMSEIISQTYEIVSCCLNGILGENFSKEIFNGKKDFRMCIKAFNDLVKAKNEQEQELEREINDLQRNVNVAQTKYSGNRATRRANQ